jgi:hypothetical protein
MGWIYELPDSLQVIAWIAGIAGGLGLILPAITGNSLASSPGPPWVWRS